MTETVTLGRQEHLTFKGNLKTTRYGWLRLTPSYSVHTVSALLDELQIEADGVLDPYCGTGTTALVCAERGLPCVTTDINPFLVWLAEVKTSSYSGDEINDLRVAAEAVAVAMEASSDPAEWVPNLHQIEKWWDATTLHALGRGMAEIRSNSKYAAVSHLLRVAFCRTLIQRAAVSFGHQSMSFKTRKEQEALLSEDDLIQLVSSTWRAAIDGIAHSAQSSIAQRPEVLLCDARKLSASLREHKFSCVITSPPYPNRMSYIRELRPYMYWLGYLSNGRDAGELDWKAIGGTWGCATSNVGKWEPEFPRTIAYEDFDRIIRAIGERSDVLGRYVHKYFYDMTDHIRGLAEVVASGGGVHYIVGNSKFYDVLLPVQEIYAGILSEAGFSDVTVKAIRKRSSKRELFEYVVSATQP